MPKYFLKDCDIFYISFDEPNCDVNWERVKSIAPTAKRIHGVVGFDKAHRVCAEASTTNRLVIIDGDNWLNDDGLDQEIDDTGVEDACFSFKSQNIINGLEYGNGGIKVWNKEILLNSKTHERANSVDFCWDIRYYQVDFIASATVQNCTPYQAWRAGYREGIKMSFVEGKPLEDFTTQWNLIWKGNLSRLFVWATIGRDCENGIWSILGARQALNDMLTKSIKHTCINDYHWMSDKFRSISDNDPEEFALYFNNAIRQQGIFIPEFDKDTSIWFKSIYMNPKREGLMW